MSTRATNARLTDYRYFGNASSNSSFGYDNNMSDYVDPIDIEAFERLVRIQEIANIFVPLVLSLLLVLGIVTNALVVYVTISTNRTSKHPIHSIFVLNLAVADVLFLIVSAPYYITILSVHGWRFGAFLCPVIPFLSTVAVAGSIYTISALAWIRFMALVMPFRFRRSCISTKKAGYIVVAAIWIASVILSVPFLIYYRLELREMEGYVCRWIGPESALDAYALVKLTATYIFPLILVTFFYAVVGREVLCYMMHRNSAMNRGSSDERKECIKSTVVVLSLILAFLICWLGRLLETIFKISGVMAGPDYAAERVILGIATRCFAYAHAFVNPFIYTFASPIFRRNLRSSFREKIRNCKAGDSFCNKGRSASVIVRRKPGSEEQLSLGLRNTKLPTNVPTSTVVHNSRDGATTPRTEQLQLLTLVESHSHPTEITRLALSDPSAARSGDHPTLGASNEWEEENNLHHPMLKDRKQKDAA